jgi:hypothetical protein
MAARGIPVVCAATTHYGRRGFTFDPRVRDEYWRVVESLLAAPPDDVEAHRRRELARRYAYLFFFRYHQILDAVHEDGRSRPRVRVADSTKLGPGHNASLDRILDGVLSSDGPVVSPAAVG